MGWPGQRVSLCPRDRQEPGSIMSRIILYVILSFRGPKIVGKTDFVLAAGMDSTHAGL